MIKITKEQKKIIYISVTVVAFLIIFWVVVYTPQNRRLLLIKNELQSAEAEISEIDAIMRGKELPETLKDLSIEFNRISQTLLSEDEDVISYLSEEARKLNINVRGITPSAKQKLDSQVAGYTVYELPVSMKLVCEFSDLGKYLEMLRNDFPVLIRVRQLELEGKGKGHPRLEALLDLSAYLAD
ncbi:hypothetical protein ACFL1K_01415 [Candidatus Omnitrophota bacterium]